MVFTLSSSCKKDILIEDIQFNTVEKTSISGFILDEDGNAIGNARVEIEGVIVYTDSKGYFIINDLVVSNKNIVIIAEKEGFYKSQSVNLQPTSTSVTVNIKLEKIYTLSASK